MDRTIYVIEMKSLRACLHHLQTLDLAELAVGARHYGSAADAALVEHIRDSLQGVPPTHP